MGIARNIARLVPNGSGLLPNANIEAVAASKLTGQLPVANAISGSIVRTYFASSGTGVNIAGTNPMTDLGLNFSNVVINSGETPILSLHVTCRLVSGTFMHAALRVRYTGSATGAVGDNEWGLGINFADFSWNNYTVSNINLKQVRGNPFNSTGTFNFFVQAGTAGATVMFGGENSGPNSTYGHLHGTIMIVKD